MHSYPHHIGDFRSGTFNMSRQERWIYRDMTDIYYDTEKPLTSDLDVLCNDLGVRSDEERDIVERVLKYKFKLTDQGYMHVRCEEVIADYKEKAKTAQQNGRLGGRPPKKADGNQNKPSGFQSGSDEVSTTNPDITGSQANQEPITNNQKPKESKASAPSEKISLNADGEWTAIAPQQRLLWERAYPALSLDAELAKAAAWLIANPKHKKSNYARFLTNWFSRAQDSARPAFGGHAAPSQPNRQEALEARNREVAARISREYADEFQ